MVARAGEGEATVGGDRLLLAIAEELKLPLLQIARQAELSGQDSATSDELALMQHSAEAALKLVDGYLLGLQLASGQTSLVLEPVSLSSTLVDVAHQLDHFARPYNVELEVVVAGKYPPVMAHASALKAALLSLGAAMVQALPAQQTQRRKQFMQLAIHQTSQGLVTGLYSRDYHITNQSLQQAVELCGQARQPFTGLSASGAAGIFVADTLLRAMTSRLRAGRYHRISGLAAALPVSRQLQLV